MSTEIETRICKANPFGKFQEITDQVIIINGKIPQYRSIPESEEFHDKQAEMISKALHESLPQGTYDRLGIMFLQKKLSLYQGRTERAF